MIGTGLCVMLAVTLDQPANTVTHQGELCLSEYNGVNDYLPRRLGNFFLRVLIPKNYDKVNCVGLFHKKSCSIRVVKKTNPDISCKVYNGVG
ncbi:hypothetical protein QYF61_004375 [Mycteria americana]|uniref:Uncharacterized protein n=1 Tax=Mycteria americana TaxID=33587 RepID=A0AAN7N784_MYCAM|nr:hypothetical protein QYF61_004375 [Mycteria americana]